MGWRRRRGIGGRRERVVTFLLAPAPSCPGPPVATAERGTGSRQDCASVTRRAAGSGSAHAVGLYLALITGEGIQGRVDTGTPGGLSVRPGQALLTRAIRMRPGVLRSIIGRRTL